MSNAIVVSPKDIEFAQAVSEPHRLGFFIGGRYIALALLAVFQ